MCSCKLFHHLIGCKCRIDSTLRIMLLPLLLHDNRLNCYYSFKWGSLISFRISAVFRGCVKFETSSDVSGEPSHEFVMKDFVSHLMVFG